MQTSKLDIFNASQSDISPRNAKIVVAIPNGSKEIDNEGKSSTYKPSGT